MRIAPGLAEQFYVFAHALKDRGGVNGDVWGVDKCPIEAREKVVCNKRTQLRDSFDMHVKLY